MNMSRKDSRIYSPLKRHRQLISLRKSKFENYKTVISLLFICSPRGINFHITEVIMKQ